MRVFGSVARGEATADSDVDFLVELKPQSSLFDYIGLMQDLAALLGRKVDIAEPDNLRKLPTTSLRVSGGFKSPEFTRLSVKSLRFSGHLTYKYVASL
ncbi:hypothetical protein NIES80_00240 [Dolichospermum planctonicum]|uniref:Polymerase nucleotidyl transferase domain-containing protein n=1 Tax=Dolichospermum planctonicum TaxID=136072 RepID=A0A480A5K2_9CYAN|nr:hypothetical protein NIES80_00240 [Dolichospermum planctonicum]